MASIKTWPVINTFIPYYIKNHLEDKINSFENKIYLIVDTPDEVKNMQEGNSYLLSFYASLDRSKPWPVDPKAPKQ